MRSSNLSHLKTPAKTRRHAEKSKSTRKVSKLGSVIVTAMVVFSAVIIPSVTLIQNVEAVTNKKNTVFSAGNNDVFSDVILNSGKPEVKVEKKETVKVVKETQPETKATEPETTKPAETTKPTTAPTTATETAESSESVSVEKNLGSLSTANSSSGYSPRHISLSDYDRAKLERLVMGEAENLGYNGAALVAQTIRDNMIELNTNSIDTIISELQYSAPTTKSPSPEVKRAVSTIFDNDGYAVKHRVLYFYDSDVVSSSWHESQEFIISYGSERFFDSWD